MGKQLTAAVVAAALAMAASAQRLRAQEATDAGPLGYFGVAFYSPRPTGDFAEAIDGGWGLGGHAGLWLVEGIVGLRADVGFIEYGSVSRSVCLSSTVGCRIEVDLNTANDVFMGSLGPQLTFPFGPVRPYVAGGIGFAYFQTQSTLRGLTELGLSESGLATTNFDDWTFAWTAVGGLQLLLKGGAHPFALDISAHYHGNGEAAYLTEDDIVDEPDGSISIFPNRGDTNLFTFEFGFSVGFPREPVQGAFR